MFFIGFMEMPIYRYFKKYIHFLILIWTWYFVRNTVPKNFNKIRAEYTILVFLMQK